MFGHSPKGYGSLLKQSQGAAKEGKTHGDQDE